MFLHAQKRIQDQVALRGALEALLLDMFEENFLLFSHLLSLVRHDFACLIDCGRILSFRDMTGKKGSRRGIFAHVPGWRNGRRYGLKIR